MPDRGCTSFQSSWFQGAGSKIARLLHRCYTWNPCRYSHCMPLPLTKNSLHPPVSVKYYVSRVALNLLASPACCAQLQGKQFFVVTTTKKQRHYISEGTCPSAAASSMLSSLTGRWREDLLPRMHLFLYV